MKKILLTIFFFIMLIVGIGLGINGGRMLLSMDSDIAVITGFLVWVATLLGGVYGAYKILRFIIPND